MNPNQLNWTYLQHSNKVDSMGLDRLVHFESSLNVGYCGYNGGHPKNRYNQCSVNAQTHNWPFIGDGENIDKQLP